MHLVNPFETEGQWFKANFHTHTTTSDGEVAAAERVEQYRGQGYHVLAITDHRATNDVAALSSDDFLVISGIEAHPACDGHPDPYHFVGLNVPQGFEAPDETAANDMIKKIKDAGGETIVAHPYWCGHTLEHLLPLEGHVGIEVYNATCSRIGKAFSSVHWDNLLDAGVVLPASACDDTHKGRDIFMGWTMIKARELTADAVLEALRTGCSYASCGPEIYDWRLVDGKAMLKCSPAKEVHFLCARSSGTALYQDGGEPITEAEFTPNASRKYVRAEVVDAAGNHAWTQPILLAQDDGA